MAVLGSTSSTKLVRNVEVAKPAPARSAMPARSRRTCVVAASAVEPAETVGRRQMLQTIGVAASSLVASPIATAAKAPAGFSAVEDQQDNYRFLYPFGWQEVAVKGCDIVYKDVVEPLESVSVTILSTDKQSILEFGDVAQVAETLARNVLTPPGQEVTVLSADKREYNGRDYVIVEFTAKAARYTKHQLAVVTVGNGAFYTLTTGANEKRWPKVGDKLKKVVESFALTV